MREFFFRSHITAIVDNLANGENGTADEAIEAILNLMKPISVRDAMPPDNLPVLVYTKVGRSFTRTIAYHNSKGWFKGDELMPERLFMSIQFWYPAPDLNNPPKSEEDVPD